MNGQKNERNRIASYDIIRAIAIFLVVLCHATESIYVHYFSNDVLVGQASTLVTSFMFTLGRLGVPFFLFLTGALVLKKQIEKDGDVLDFYKKICFL